MSPPWLRRRILMLYFSGSLFFLMPLGTQGSDTNHLNQSPDSWCNCSRGITSGGSWLLKAGWHKITVNQDGSEKENVVLIFITLAVQCVYNHVIITQHLHCDLPHHQLIYSLILTSSLHPKTQERICNLWGTVLARSLRCHRLWSACKQIWRIASVKQLPRVWLPPIKLSEACDQGS